MEENEVKDPFKTKEEVEKERIFKLSKKYDKQIFKRIFAYSVSKIKYFIVGIIMALINGCIFPVFSIFLAHLLEALLILDFDPTDAQALKDVDLYSLVFFILSIGAFIITTIQIWFFSIVGEEITKKIRI